MAITSDKIIELFCDLSPARIAEATDLWLKIEQGERAQLPVLRRLLHTIKGEAQMIGFVACSRVAQAAERLVDTFNATGLVPTESGDALLGAFDLIGLLSSKGAEIFEAQIDEVCRDLESANQEVQAAAPAPTDTMPAVAASAAPSSSTHAATPGEATLHDKKPSTFHAQAVPIDALQPVAAEIERLHGEHAILLPQLGGIAQIMKALADEMRPGVDLRDIADRLTKWRRNISDLERRLGGISAEWSAFDFSSGLAIERLSDLVRQASVVSTARLAGQIQRVGRSTAAALKKSVEVNVVGEAQLDLAVERHLGPALMHLVRNAIDHGIEAPDLRRQRGKADRGRVDVLITQLENAVRITVEDDGGGVRTDKLRAKLIAARPEIEKLSDRELLPFVFEHGVSTSELVTEISGRGIGLDVVSTELREVGGRVQLESTPDVGTRFVLVVPSVLRVDTVVPVMAGPLRCALPSRRVLEVLRVDHIENTDDGLMLRRGDKEHGRLVPLRSLAALFGGRGEPRHGDAVLVLDHPEGVFAVTVESYGTPRPLAAQPSDQLAFATHLVRGVAPTPDGGVMLLLDVDGLRGLMARAAGSAVLRAPSAATGGRHVLLVEDSPVALALLTGIVRSFGLRVTDTVNGEEGLAAARRDRPDLILTDIEMPIMDGLEMIGKLRADPALQAIPILVLTTRDNEATRAAALALGVHGFLSKQRFVEDELRQVIDAALSRR